jgi:pentatricopeptide repeat protein
MLSLCTLVTVLTVTASFWLDACGRSGEYLHALQLFRNMTSAGIAADTVAYNTLFHSFRVAGKADLAYELWEEMCGAQTLTIDGRRPPNAGPQATPDIITVTDLIATLSDRKGGSDFGKVDGVFANAVNRGIVLASYLDSLWEVDLSGMSLPVARAACRFVLKRTRQTLEQGAEVMDLNFITGVGMGQGRQNNQSDTEISSIVKHGKGKATSLRDYIQEVLEVEFAMKSTVPKMAQGTVQIEKSELARWVRRNHQL